MRPLDLQARRLWWLTLGLAAANVLALVLLVLPVRSQRGQQENQLLDLQRRIRGVQREAQSGTVQLTAFQEVEEFAQGFPQHADLVPLIGRLTKLARSLALEVPSVSYNPEPIKEAGLIKVTVTMGVDGTYGKIRRFLYDLETMRRELVIESLSLKDPRMTSDLQVQLRLAVYIRPPAAEG